MTIAAQLHHSSARAPAMPPQIGLVVDVEPAKSNCERCSLNGICLPEGLVAKESQEYTAMIYHNKRLWAGQALFRAGESFHQLYFVKTGSLRSTMLMNDGREQVTGFYFAGDVLGLDAIRSPTHPSEATALENTNVCAIPFSQLTRMSQRVEQLQVYVQRLLARELVRDKGIMMLLGRMQADERVATFLLNMSQRFMARGYSPLEFVLPMSREDIGNYLGIKLETVSRCLARLKCAKVLAVESRRIRILNFDALMKVIGGTIAAC